MRSNYRKYDSFSINDMELDEVQEYKEEVVNVSDVEQLIDDIESEVDYIIDSIKDFDVKVALEKLEDLANKLY